MPLLEESLLRYIENDTFSWLRKNLKCVGNVLQQGMAESCYSCAITDAARAISIIKRVKGYPCNPSVQEMVDCLHHFAPPRPGIHIRIGGKGIPNTFPNACNYGKFVGYYSRSAYCYQGVVQDCREPLLVDGSHGPENQKIFLTGFGSKSRTITKKDKAEAIELLQAQPFVGRILVKENFKTWNPSVSHLYPGVSDAERKDYFEAKNKTRNLKYESRKKSVLEDILSKRGDGSSEKIVQVERVNEPVSRGILSHAILVVSHGTLQEVDENGSVSEIDYFTCKNSHGRSFGCCGFVKVPMDQVDLIYYPHEVVIEELSDGKKEEMKKAIQESRAAASKRDKDELEKILKELLVDGLITDDEVKSNS